MTCVVGLIDKKGNSVIIGADSASVGDYDISIRKDTKVFKNGEFVIGCTSSFRMIQLLRFSFTPPVIGEKDVYEYMCTDFINAVRECFKEGGYLQKYTDGDDKGGTFLVAHKDRLFKVESDFQVGERMDNYEACGSGQDYALGALSVLSSLNKSPELIVVRALETAERFSNSVSSPFVLVRT